MPNEQIKSSFTRAVKARTPIKISLQGISFSGKTMSAIKLAKGLARGKEVFVIDSENGSASLYDHLNFMHAIVKPPFKTDDYIKLIREAVALGAGCIVIDSGTHAWQYILDYKDQLDAAGGKGPNWGNWAKAKPLWTALKDAILQSPVHVIVCFREQSEYAIDSADDGRGNRKNTVTKIGTKARTEEGTEYEFTVAWKLQRDTHFAYVEKDRTDLFDGRSFLIDEAIGHEILAWLGDGDFIPTPEWELLQSGLSSEFMSASADAEKARKDQAARILTTRKITKEVQMMLVEACKAAELPFSQLLIDGDRYGATNADRLIRYICQHCKIDPVPICRMNAGAEQPRVTNRVATPLPPKTADAAEKHEAEAVQTQKAETKPIETATAEQAADKAEKAAAPSPEPVQNAAAPKPETVHQTQTSKAGPVTDLAAEKNLLIEKIVVAMVNRGWSDAPADVAAVAGELSNTPSIKEIEDLGNIRLQRVLEKLENPNLNRPSSAKDAQL